MGIILDLSIVTIIVLFVISGYKRGVVRSVLELVGYIAIIFLSGYLSTFISKEIYRAFFEPSITQKINGVLEGCVNQDIESKAIAVFNFFPSFISKSFSLYGININSISNAITNASSNAACAVEDLISPIIINAIKVVVLFLLFIILSFVLNLVVKTVGRIFRLPLLRPIDGILGSIFGILKGAVAVYLVVLVIKVYSPMISNVTNMFSYETIESTTIFKYFYDNNILYKLIEQLNV